MTDFSYITALANDGDIQERVAACAANKGERDPLGFATQYRWKIAAHGAGAEALAAVYEYAERTKTINVNQRTGQRTDSITDAMLEAAVDAVIAERDAELAAQQAAQSPPA
jgi:hypothetical protein